MNLIRLLSENFDPVYVKPRVLARAARELLPLDKAALPAQRHGKPHIERRVNQRRAMQRRQQQHAVLMELRNPGSRRKGAGRRRTDYLSRDHASEQCGIDTYA